MNTIQKFLLSSLLLLLLFSCNETEPESDAYGNFEATEVTVSAETNGKLLFFDVEEGQQLEAGTLVGIVDTTQVHLQKLQLQASIGTIYTKQRDPSADIRVLEEQKQNLIRERNRVQALLEDKAATPKQLDDMNGQIQVVEQQIAAARRNTQIANQGITSETRPLQAQIDLLNEQIRKSYIYNPIVGTVLVKLVEPSEIVTFGMPLYKIANLETLTLRAYLSGELLPRVKIGQEVTVRIDHGKDAWQDFPGEVTWIANKAEFTPKTIQTKEERVNLVYAIKVKVKNDGTLKIGMPGEVLLPDTDTQVKNEGKALN